MMRTCRRCGKEITDLTLHPNAKLCAVCRGSEKHLVCRRCGKEITDHDARPRSKICYSCHIRYKNRSAEIKAHKCQVCGKEISDIDIHPGAKLCPSCRETAYDPNGAIKKAVIGFLDRHDWPTFVSGHTIIQTEPDILQISPSQKPSQVQGTITKILKTLGYKKYNSENSTVYLPEIEA